MAISNKVAKKVKAGIGPRIRDKSEEQAIIDKYSGVMPPSKPKAAIAPPYDPKKDKKRFR